MWHRAQSGLIGLSMCAAVCAHATASAQASGAADKALAAGSGRTNAAAEPASPAAYGARERAAELTRLASTAYRAGDFQLALRLYRQAYDRVPAPELLFNAGQCYRQLNRGDEAQAAFTEYLRARPDAPERAQIEHWISGRPAEAARPLPIVEAAAQPSGISAAALDVDRSLVAQPQPGASPGPRDEHPAIYERWWFWTAVGALAIGSGVAIAVLAGQDDDPAPAGSLGVVRWD